MIEFTETFPQYVDFGTGFRTGYTQRSVLWSVYLKSFTTSVIHGLAWITLGSSTEELAYAFTASTPAPSGHLAWTVRFTGGQGTWRTTSAYNTLGTWYRFGVTHDMASASNDPILYVNGLPVAITETQTPSGAAASGTVNQNFGCGGWGGNTPDGYEDAPLLYNRILTPEEVLSDALSRKRITIRRGLAFAPNLLGASDASDGTVLGATNHFYCPVSRAIGTATGSPKFKASPILTYGGL